MLIILAILWGFQGVALEHSFNTQADYVYVDGLNFVYLLEGDKLEKRNVSGELKAVISFKRYGEVGYLDVSNGLKPLIFYRDQSEMLLLDNMLSITGDPVNLLRDDMGQIGLVCQSQDQHFWLYDLSYQKLIRVNRFFERVTTSGFVYQLTGEEINPGYMTEYQGQLYISDPAKGVFVFDLFGSFVRKISRKDIGRFQIIDQSLYYLVDGQFYRYDMQLREEGKIELPLTEVKDVVVSQQHLFVLQKGRLSVFKQALLPAKLKE